jgi:hypothetical protein
MCERRRVDLWLTGKIEAIHRRSKGMYGSPPIHAELAHDHGIRVGRKRVARPSRTRVWSLPPFLRTVARRNIAADYPYRRRADQNQSLHYSPDNANPSDFL